MTSCAVESGSGCHQEAAHIQEGAAAVLPPFVLSRLLLFVFVGVSLEWWPVHPVGGQWQAFPHCPWLDGWARWDSGWYWTIFQRGYYFHAGEVCNPNFFPLFAWVAGAVSLPLRMFLSPPQAFYLAAIGVANVAFLVALWGVFLLGRALVGREAARRALWLVCFNPFSFYFSAAYAEGLYFALVTWAFVMARRERWHAACLLAAASLLTRPHGFVMAATMVVLYASSRGFAWRRLDRQVCALLWMPLAAVALHVVWWDAVGDPWAWEKASAAWRAGGGPMRVFWQVWHIVSEPGWYGYFTALSVATLLLWVIASSRAHRRFGWGYTCFTLGSLGLSGLSSLDGLGRYACPVFPPYLVWGEALSRPWLLRAVLAVSGLLMLTCAYRFTHWFPA